MTTEEIKEILDKHKLWLRSEDGGQRADLRGAYLQGAYLRGADLRGADLQRAYLQGADLRGADLRGADLQRAYLQGADLRGAYLQGAYLRGADLQGAYLQGADKIMGIGPIGEEGRIVYAVQHESTVMFQAGCHWGNYEDTRARVVAKYGEESSYTKSIDLMYLQLNPESKPIIKE